MSPPAQNRLLPCSPLLHDVSPTLKADVARWEHLQNVGIEELAFVFPRVPPLSNFPAKAPSRADEYRPAAAKMRG